MWSCFRPRPRWQKGEKGKANWLAPFRDSSSSRSVCAVFYSPNLPFLLSKKERVRKGKNPKGKKDIKAIISFTSYNSESWYVTNLDGFQFSEENHITSFIMIMGEQITPHPFPANRPLRRPNTVPPVRLDAGVPANYRHHMYLLISTIMRNMEQI